MPDLPAVIAECLGLHAESMHRLGTEQPELNPRVDPGLRDKIVRQRAKVSASFESTAEDHARHVESLNKGLRIVLRRLAPPRPKPAAPPMPVWDDVAKAWRIPVSGQLGVAAPGRHHGGPGSQATAPTPSPPRDPGQIDTGDPGRPFDDEIPFG
jgi:hypothetical protein